MPLKTQKIGKKAILFILTLFFLAGGFFALREWQYRKQITMLASDDDRKALFVVEENSLPPLIAEKLENEGFIVSASAFLRYAKKNSLATKLQAGRFFLSKNLTIPVIAEALTHAQAEEMNITLLEGWTVAEMDAHLTALGLIVEGEFLTCIEKTCDFRAYDFLPAEREALEGFFFPDTYTVSVKNFSPQVLAEKMLTNFQRKITPLLPDIKKSGYSLGEVVIMASILEKETKTTEERPQVADIFWRRLEAGMPLGADATVRFFTGKKTEDITVDDLKEDNPYNTRLHKGLTPTAICNPGLESLRAVVYPQKNDYWYFLHGSDGEIHYAKTLEEHAKNKRDYL